MFDVLLMQKVVEYRFAYFVRHFTKLSFSDAAKFQNTELPMLRSRTNKENSETRFRVPLYYLSSSISSIKHDLELYRYLFKLNERGDKLFLLQCCFLHNKAGWSSGNPFGSGAGGLRFKSRAGQIEHSVVNGLPPLRHFERNCVARAQ